MTRRRRFAVLGRVLLAGAFVLAGATDDRALEARVQRVAAELRCLVCQNQSLADSHAPLALDLKQQVREQLRAGRSEDDVVAYMTARYGDFVRYRPPLKASTLLLWWAPALLLLGGGALLAAAVRRRHGAAETVDDARREQARQLLEGGTAAVRPRAGPPGSA